MKVHDEKLGLDLVRDVRDFSSLSGKKGQVIPPILVALEKGNNLLEVNMSQSVPGL
jgi:hypothetical protein